MENSDEPPSSLPHRDPQGVPVRPSKTKNAKHFINVIELTISFRFVPLVSTSDELELQAHSPFWNRRGHLNNHTLPYS